MFAARPTFTALLVPSDLDDLARELPGLAAEVIRGLHQYLMKEWQALARGLCCPPLVFSIGWCERLLCLTDCA